MPPSMPATPISPDFRLTIASRRENVALARHVLAGYGDAGVLSHERLSEVLLAVSEAVTNVVERLDRSPSLTVTGHVRDRELVVAVYDGGHGVEPRPDPTGLAQGLPIMAALADRVTFRDHDPEGAEIVLTFGL